MKILKENEGLEEKIELKTAVGVLWDIAYNFCNRSQFFLTGLQDEKAKDG